MNKRRKSWGVEQLRVAVKNSRSIRQVIEKLRLIPAGGNYEQVKRVIQLEELDIKHFTGKGWNKGIKGTGKRFISLEKILVKDSTFQSFKLKKRLYLSGLKTPKCEFCGWNNKAIDGRIPLELDHINGDKHDNRIGNLRILCPNCHSLQSTHRGKNQKNFKKA